MPQPLEETLHGYYAEVRAFPVEEVESKVPSPPKPENTAGEYEAKGKVVRVRRFSRRLLFADVRLGHCALEGEDEGACGCGKVDVVMAAPMCADMSTLHRGMKLGDTVRVRGQTLTLKERSPPRVHLEATAVEIVEKAAHVKGEAPLVERAEALRKPLKSTMAATASTEASTTPSTSDHKGGVRHEGLCKFWINTGKCERGETCPYTHPTGEALIAQRKEWVARRVAERMERQQREADPYDPASKGRKSTRAQAFATWIRTTFPGARHVLDVAGGKGQVGLTLEQGGGLTATLVDPRERVLSKAVRRLAGRGGGALNPHLREWFENPPSLTIDKAIGLPDTLLIGLHPDQATEAIVDVGLARGIPWAVVPCCVFPALFPDRVWPGEGGGEVNTTEKLIDYLLTKAPKDGPAIQEAYLPFEGRNRVLYWVPQSASADDV